MNNIWPEIIKIAVTVGLTVSGTFIVQRCSFQDQLVLKQAESALELRKSNLAALDAELKANSLLVRTVDEDVQKILPIIGSSPQNQEQADLNLKMIRNLNAIQDKAFAFPRPIMIVFIKAKNHYGLIYNKKAFPGQPTIPGVDLEELCDASPHGGSCRDIGFYFLQGGFGVIFPPNSNELRRPRIVKAENPAFWVLNTSKEYGHGVASGYMTPDHCGIADESLMQNQNWKDALFCYELGKNAKGLKERPAVFDRFMSGYSVAMFNTGRQSEAIALLESLLSENTSLPLCGEYLYKLRQVKSQV